MHKIIKIGNLVPSCTIANSKAPVKKERKLGSSENFSTSLFTERKTIIDQEMIDTAPAATSLNIESEESNVAAPPRDYKTRLIARKNDIEYRSDFIGNNCSSIKIKEIKYYGVNGNGKNIYKLS